MDNLQITIDREVDEQRLIGDLRAAFPLLSSEMVEMIVLPRKGRKVLQINTTKIAIEQINRVIAEHVRLMSKTSQRKEAMAKIQFQDKVQQDSLFQAIRTKYPALKGVAMGVDRSPGGGYILQIDAADVNVQGVKQLIEQHKLSQHQASQRQAPQDQPTQDQAQEQELYADEEEIRQMVQMAVRVPGAKEVMLATLAVMSQAEAIMQDKADMILGNVATLETNVKILQRSVAEIKESMGAQGDEQKSHKEDLDRLFEKTESIQRQIELFSTMFSFMQDGMEKARKKREEEEAKMLATKMAAQG